MFTAGTAGLRQPGSIGSCQLLVRVSCSVHGTLVFYIYRAFRCIWVRMDDCSVRRVSFDSLFGMSMTYLYIVFKLVYTSWMPSPSQPVPSLRQSSSSPSLGLPSRSLVKICTSNLDTAEELRCSQVLPSLLAFPSQYGSGIRGKVFARGVLYLCRRKDVILDHRLHCGAYSLLPVLHRLGSVTRHSTPLLKNESLTVPDYTGLKDLALVTNGLNIQCCLVSW
jgi:hypothetical protein